MQNSLQQIWFLYVLLIINISSVVSYTGNVGYNSNSNLNNYNSGSNFNTYNSGSNLNTYNNGYGSNLNSYNNGYGSKLNTYNSGYGSNLNSYNSGYGSKLNNYNSGYGSNLNNYNSGYVSNINSGYGTKYNSGYGSNYNSGYGTNYNKGYGTNYNQGYTKGYRSGYGSNYAKNFYNTFPFFFMNPFGSGYSGFQSGLPWYPFSSFPMSYGHQSGFNPYGHNMYGVHPLFRYTGNYGVYQNYGYGNRHLPQRNHMMLPVPVGMPFGGQSNQFIFQRRPSLGERIMNSPLLPAALIAAPLLLLAKGKK
ncbi:putative mediator of RNA polymerase II transcription subunit 26 [Mytilus edulis]|uniref:putative mediator of RNA polymerase II transcription subunit 26 n=1 Tax=Mytilus edulis TaxID=6550 RepID=UPI0039EF7B4B